MDYQTVLRHYPYLMLFILLLMVGQRQVNAQAAQCPDHTYRLSDAPGSWPPMAACIAPSNSDTNLIYHADLPCGGGIRTHRVSPSLNDHPLLTLANPASVSYPSGQAKVSFLFQSFDYPLFNPNNDPVSIRLESFSSANARIGSYLIDTATFPQLTTSVENDLVFYGYMHTSLIEDVLITAEAGGYLTLQVVDPAFISLPSYMYESFRIIDRDASREPLCTIPGSQLTPTATPSATASPTPTQTPTPGLIATSGPTQTPPTPITPSATATSWPTSVGGTPSPAPSHTPFTLSTIPAESTPTPLSAMTIPAITIPTIDFSGIGVGAWPTPDTLGVALTPNATTVARRDEIATLTAENALVITRWYTATQAGLGILGSSHLTTTTGISTPAQITAELITLLRYPIQWLKAFQAYFPNFWSLIQFFLGAAILIFFTLFTKFAIALLTEPPELIRRLIELIPGF